MTKEQELKEEIEEKFFKYAYCYKCHLNKGCKCEIMEPVMMMAQFKQAFSSQRQEDKKIFEKMIYEKLEIIEMEFDSKLDEYFDKEIQRQEARTFIRDFIIGLKSRLNEEVEK